jgi:hypothetical protein
MAASPSSRDIDRAAKRLRADLEENGLLLAHDALLPSATRSVAGEPIRGSWWGHPKGTLIYAALQEVAPDIARVKLVGGKSTLVHRRLWPALAAVARARQPWQTKELSKEELELFEAVERAGRVRTDTLGKPAERAARVRRLEARLLVYSETEHTPSGQHVKVLVPFRAWQSQSGILDVDLPAAESALEALTAPVRAWVGERLEGLLPWLPPPAGRRFNRGGRS